MLRTNVQKLFALPLALVLASGSLMAASGSAFAEGEGPDTTPVEPTELQLRIESSATAYNDAVDRVNDLQRRIEQNGERIAEIEAQLPEQQRKADAAFVSMYKLSGSGSLLTEVLTGLTSFDDLMTTLDYLAGIAQGQLDAIAELKQMQRDLNQAETELLAEKAEAEEVKVQAEKALAEAQAARQEAVAAMAANISDAEVEAVKQQAVNAAVEQAKADAQASGASEEEVQAQAEQARAQATEAVSNVTATTIASGGVDWSMDKSSFVSEWSSRIDTYLDGSPLAGQGSTFAEAAWNYGVDPRWSPAIANTESTKGQYCFADHNAWGWGSSNWDTWEEAINDHVEGLANGYGSTITQEGAEKYCPPEADFWYETTLDQMNKI